jgi:hypothetical protein
MYALGYSIPRNAAGADLCFEGRLRLHQLCLLAQETCSAVPRLLLPFSLLFRRMFVSHLADLETMDLDTASVVSEIFFIAMHTMLSCAHTTPEPLLVALVHDCTTELHPGRPKCKLAFSFIAGLRNSTLLYHRQQNVSDPSHLG